VESLLSVSCTGEADSSTEVVSTTGGLYTSYIVRTLQQKYLLMIGRLRDNDTLIAIFISERWGSNRVTRSTSGSASLLYFIMKLLFVLS